MCVCIQQQAGYIEEDKERVLGSWSTEPPGTSQSIFLLPILRSGWGCITTQNTKATLKCYVPHSTVWTSSSHDKLFAWRSVLWRWFVAAHVVGQQIKRKEKDSHTIRTVTQSGSHTIRQPHNQDSHTIRQPHNQDSHTIRTVTQSGQSHNQDSHTIRTVTQSGQSHNQDSHTIRQPHNQSFHPMEGMCLLFSVALRPQKPYAY